MSDYQVCLCVFLKAAGKCDEIHAANWFAEEWHFCELLGEDMPDPALCAEDYLAECGGEVDHK